MCPSHRAARFVLVQGVGQVQSYPGFFGDRRLICTACPQLGHVFDVDLRVAALCLLPLAGQILSLNDFLFLLGEKGDSTVPRRYLTERRLLRRRRPG